MKRVTIKVGSTFFIDDKTGKVATRKILKLCEQIAILKESGVDVCLVTSGAIAVGVKKMKLKRKPTETNKKQALAAIGQMYLMQVYEQIFDMFNLKCAQILLSHDDFGNRGRINNLTTTLNALLDMGVTPIVNENDAVATSEIKVGDNDTLSAMTSLAINSSLLVLVSDVDGLFTANPNTCSNAQFIPIVEKIDHSIINLAKAPSSEFGTGGMATKIKAAQIATTAGIPMVIINQNQIENLAKVCQGEKIGTYFCPSEKVEPIKKCWLQFCANVRGEIVVDQGAKNALESRKSLLSCGVKKVNGLFNSGDVVNVLDEFGNCIAIGVIAFSNETLKNIIKQNDNPQLIIHANNIVILGEN